MNLTKYLDELESDIDDRYAETRAAEIVNEVSPYMARLGHAQCVREWTPAAQVIEVRKYLAECIAATAGKESADIKRPYTVVQAAEVLGVSKETVYREVSEGVMPHTKARGRIVISAEDLAKYRERTAAKLPTPPGQFRHLGRRRA